MQPSSRFIEKRRDGNTHSFGSLCQPYDPDEGSTNGRVRKALQFYGELGHFCSHMSDQNDPTRHLLLGEWGWVTFAVI